MSSTQAYERTVTRNFLTLGSGELIARTISFIAMIYVARRLGAESYGIVGFAQAFILYFAAIADFGIEDLGPREIAVDPSRIQRVASSVLAARMLISLALVLAFVVAGGLFMPQPDGAVLAVFSLTLLAVGGSTKWIHLGLERTGYVALARIVGDVLKAVLIVATVGAAADVVNVAAAHVIGEVAAAVLLGFGLYRNGIRLRPHLDFSVVLPVFRSSWPLVLVVLLGLVIYNADLIFLRLFRDTEDVGYYLAAYTLIALLGNLGTTYYASLLPTLTRASQTENFQRELYHSAIAHVFAVGLPVAIGGSLLGPEIIRFWYGAEYAASGTVLQVLILTIPFLLVSSVLRAVLIAAGRQDRVMWITIWAASLNVAANLFAIPRYGMIGAAWVTVLTDIVRMGMVQVYVCKAGFPITGIGRLWRPLAAVVAMAAMLTWTDPASMWIALGVGAAAYVAALGFSGGISMEKGRLPALKV